MNNASASCSSVPNARSVLSWRLVCSQHEHVNRGISGVHRRQATRRTLIWRVRRLTKWAFHCSSRHKRQNLRLASLGMKASFSVAVWPILDPLFLVLVGTTSGRLKIHLPGRHLPRNGLSSIAVFAMLCEHKSIWSYFSRHFAGPFLFASESLQGLHYLVLTQRQRKEALLRYLPDNDKRNYQLTVRRKGSTMPHRLRPWRSHR